MPPKDDAKAYLHCRTCAPLKPPNVSQEQYGRISVGLTDRTIRVWCLRCDLLVAEFTPEHLAKLLAKPPVCAMCAAGVTGHVHK